MNAWMEALGELVKTLLGDPGSNSEWWAASILGVLTLLFVLGRAGSAFGIPNTGVWHSLLSAVLGVALVLAIMVACMLYLPLWDTAEWRVWILVGAGLLASFVLVIPLMCLLQRTGYIAALLAWFSSVAAMAVVILLVGIAFDATASGSRSADKGAARKQQIEDLAK